MPAPGPSGEPEHALVLAVQAPVFQVAQQPFAADEAVDQRRDVGGLGDGAQQGFEFGDLAGEAPIGGVGQQGEDFVAFGCVPGGPGGGAGGVVGRPVGHVQPLDVGDRDGGADLGFRLHQDGGDGAVLVVQRDGQFVEADAGVARRVLRQEGEDEAAGLDAVDDLAAPVVAVRDAAAVAPGVVAGLAQVVFHEVHQCLVRVVAVAEEDLHDYGSVRGGGVPSQAEWLSARPPVIASAAKQSRSGRGKASKYSTRRATENLHGVPLVISIIAAHPGPDAGAAVGGIHCCCPGGISVQTLGGPPC